MKFHSISFRESFEKKVCEKMTERYILVHHSGEITNIDNGVTFCSQSLIYGGSSIYCFLELQNTNLQKIGLQHIKQNTQVFYLVFMAIGKGVLHYKSS